MFPDVRITVFDAFAQTVLCLDANTAGDIGNGQIQYEDTPAGNGAASIPLALTLTEVTARGYWRGMNIVEISATDNTMTTACIAGATKIYIDSTSRFDPSTGEDIQQAYFWDGATLTMRVPVTGIGHDGGGAFITIGTPLTGGGNPTTLPAYGPGTYVGARRYCGRIMRRSRPNSKNPQVQVTCVGLGATGGMFDKAYGTFAATAQDAGPLIYQSLEQFAARQGWQAVSLNSANFATIGSQVSMTLDTSPVSQWIDQIITAIPTGDIWTVRMGHDRTPRMLKLYTSSTDTYAYPQVLHQGDYDFEPVDVEIDDEDVTNLYNSIEVIGDTDPATNQPVADIGQDATSIGLYGQVDGAPQTVTGLKIVTDCQNYAVALLNESSGPASNNKLRIYTTTANGSPSNKPAGLSNGDVIRGVNKVIVEGFNDTGTVRNMVPDSNLNYTSGKDALWTLAGTIFNVTAGSNFNQFEIDGGAGGKSNITATAISDTIVVAPGRVYSLQGFINATGFTTAGVSSPQISWDVLDSNTLAVIAHVSQTAGSSGTLTSTSFTVPGGTNRVVLQAILVGNVTASQSIKMSQPMLVVGSTLPSSYISNAAVPHVYGLVASVVTTIDLHGMQYQECQFAAVEPDWNAEMAERSQGLANALRQNTLPPVSIAQYCVSFEAFPHSGGHLAIPTSGLTVNPPTFLALFASGTNIQTVSGATFTCQPKATNWAWLNPNLTWTVKQDPSPVAGAILYALFQAHTAAIIGQTQKAPVGVMKIGLGNVNVASNLPLPTFSSGSGALANVGSTHPTQADISASVNLNNVPQDGSAHSLYWAYREHGTTQWIAYAEDDLQGVPNPPASQTKGYVYAQMANGKLFDFAVGYVGFAGYGGPQQIGTTPQQTNGFAAKTLLVTLPYHDTGSIVNPSTSRSEIPQSTAAQTLTSTVLAGNSNFPLSGTGGLNVGDSILIDDEPLTILHVHAGASIDTTTNSANDHQNGANLTEALVVTATVSPGDTAIKVSDRTVFANASIGQAINIDGNDTFTITGYDASAGKIDVTPAATNSHAIGAIIFWEYAQNGISANGASSEVTLSFDLINQPTDNTYAFVHVWYRIHGGTGKWADAGAQAAVGTTTNPKTTPQRNSYQFGIADLANGQSYDFAVSMQSQAWHESTRHVIISNFQANALNLGTSALPKIPSGTTATATGSITGYTAVNGGAYHASYTATPVITPPALDPRAFNTWGAGFAIYAKVRDQSSTTTTTLTANYHTVGTTGPFSIADASHIQAGEAVLIISQANGVDQLTVNSVNTGAGTFTTTTGTAFSHDSGDVVAFSDTDTARSHYSLIDEINNTTWSGAAITGITSGLSAGHAYQLAIMPIDEQNNPGPIAIFALTVAQYIGQGAIVDTPNLVPDPEFEHVVLSGGKAVSDPDWAPYGNDGVTIYIGPGGFHGCNSLQSVYRTDDGFGLQQMSHVIQLKGGTTYAFGAYIDALGSVASVVAGTGPPSVAIVSHDTGNAWDFHKNDPRSPSFAPQSGLIRASAVQTLGARSIVQATYTPTADEKVSIHFNSNGCKNTTIQVFGRPQLQVGPYLGPFQPGPKVKGTRPTLVPLNADQPYGPCDTQNGAALGTGGGYYDHLAHSWQTRGVIDTSANILNVEFPGTLLGKDGSLTGFSAAGISSSRAFGPFVTGDVVHLKASFTPDNIANIVRLILGNSTNGYALTWDGTGDNLIKITKYVAGVSSSLGTVATVAQTTSMHSLAMTITVLGASSNTIEISADANNGVVVGDTALDLTAGASSWPITLMGDSLVKFTSIHYSKALPHHTHMSKGVQTALNRTGQGLLNEFTGATLNSDGTLSGFAAGGTPSIATKALPAGTVIRIDGTLQIGASAEEGIILGTKTNGYAVRWAAAGAIQYGQFTAGAFTSFGTIATITQDTNPHAFALTIVSGATNSVEASFDGNIAFTASDSSQTLTTGTWAASIYGPATLKVLDYVYTTKKPHHTSMSSQVTGVVNQAGGTGLDGVFDGSTFKRVGGVGAGNKITWSSHLGDTSGDTTTSLVDTGNKRFLHTAMSTGVQTAIDSLGNLLNLSWTGISVGSGGAMSGFSNAGTSSNQAFTVGTGHVIAFEGSFKMAATTADMRFLFGNNTNGYGLEWTTGGAINVIKIVAGTVTSLVTIATVVQDLLLHSFKITVTQGASNKIEASFDNKVSAIQSDAALTLTTGTWAFTILDGNNGTTKVWNFQAYSALPHRSHAHTDYQATVTAGGGIDFSSVLHQNKNLDNIADGPTTYSRVKGSELSTGFVKQLNDGTNVRNAGAVAANMDASGNSKLVKFASPVIEGIDGTLSGFASGAGTASVTNYGPFLAGQTIEIAWQISLQTANNQNRLLLGTTTNGYSFTWYGSGTGPYKVAIEKFVAGTQTSLATVVASYTQDTKWHGIRWTITVNGASNNSFEGGIDASAPVILLGDTALDLTTGSWPITVYCAGGGVKYDDLSIKVSRAHHTAMSSQVKTTIASAAGGDGIFLNSGQVNGRHINANQAQLKHLIGDTSGDTTTAIIDGANKRGLHTFMSTAVQGTQQSTQDAFGTYTKPGQIHRGHLDAVGSPGAFNELYDPTFTKSLTDPNCPWVQQVLSGAATAVYSTDAFAGGRGKIALSGSAGINALTQTANVFNAEPYVASGVVFCTVGTAGGSPSIGVKVIGVTTSTVYATFTQTANSSGSGTPWSVGPFTISGDTQVRFQCFVNNGTGGTMTGFFHKNQLESNPQPSPYVDHYAARGHNQTHDSSANLLVHPFGNAAGIKMRLADSALTGFNATGNSSQLTYSTAQLIGVHVDVALPNTSTQVNVIIGNTTNGIVLYINGTKIALGRYTAGSYTGDWFTTTITAVANQYYRLRFAVNFNINEVEYAVDASGQGLGTLVYQPPVGKTLPTLGATAPITIIDTSGGGALLQNLQVIQQGLFLEADPTTLNTINPSVSGIGCLVNNVTVGSPVSGPTIGSGSGAPTGSAAKGSIYLRTGGSGLGTSFYVYDGSVWTAVATV